MMVHNTLLLLSLKIWLFSCNDLVASDQVELFLQEYYEWRLAQNPLIAYYYGYLQNASEVKLPFQSILQLQRDLKKVIILKNYLLPSIISLYMIEPTKYYSESMAISVI